MKSSFFVIILVVSLVCLLPVFGEANDGGYSPDYNDYVTYSVTTDYEEAAIGETMTYTIKIKNHSRYYFEAIFVNGSIENTRIDYDEYEDYEDLEHGLDP